MANLKELFPDIEQQKQALERFRRFDGGGGDGYDEKMEARVAKLEEFVTDARERLVTIETRLGETATKSDLHEMSASMIKWTVGTAVGLGVAAITVMTFVLNNATPKAAAPSPTPFVIQVPVLPAPAPAAASTAPAPAPATGSEQKSK